MAMTLKLFWQNESGASAIEFSIAAALAGISIIGGAKALGTALAGQLRLMSGELQ